MKAHFRSGAEQILDALGIVNSRQLDQDPVRSDPPHGWLHDADLVDAQPEDLDTLLDRGGYPFAPSSFGQGHANPAGVVRCDIELGGGWAEAAPADCVFQTTQSPQCVRPVRWLGKGDEDCAVRDADPGSGQFGAS